MCPETNEINLIQNKTCFNCFYDRIEKKKLHEDPCKTCYAEDTPGNRFPKHKEIP
jgi:hypothetical protein